MCDTRTHWISLQVYPTDDRDRCDSESRPVPCKPRCMTDAPPSRRARRRRTGPEPGRSSASSVAPRISPRMADLQALLDATLGEEHRRERRILGEEFVPRFDHAAATNLRSMQRVVPEIDESIEPGAPGFVRRPLPERGDARLTGALRHRVQELRCRAQRERLRAEERLDPEGADRRLDDVGAEFGLHRPRRTGERAGQIEIAMFAVLIEDHPGRGQKDPTALLEPAPVRAEPLLEL